VPAWCIAYVSRRSRFLYPWHVLHAIADVQHAKLTIVVVRASYKVRRTHDLDFNNQGLYSRSDRIATRYLASSSVVKKVIDRRGRRPRLHQRQRTGTTHQACHGRVRTDGFCLFCPPIPCLTPLQTEPRASRAQDDCGLPIENNATRLDPRVSFTLL
jgi:hypothetical protein